MIRARGLPVYPAMRAAVDVKRENPGLAMPGAAPGWGGRVVRVHDPEILLVTRTDTDLVQNQRPTDL